MHAHAHPQGESEEDHSRRVEEVRKQINQRLFVLTHGIVQVRCAYGTVERAWLNRNPYCMPTILTTTMTYA